MHTVAICIPTHNQAAFLGQAVRSALAQSYPCEVWVSDDASTDETSAVMAAILKDCPAIRHTRQLQTLGIRGNPAWTMQQPKTDFIVRLDSDDQLHPDYVAKLVKALEHYPQAGYAHAAVQEIDDRGTKRRLRLLARNPGFQNGAESLQASVSGYRVAANICIFRRAALQAVNFYRGLSFAEDWDLAVRLADAGWGNYYASEVLASYRTWDSPVRSHRKLAEVEGCRRVIEESLIPAFNHRGWSLAQIKQARRGLALRHAECLRADIFTPDEQQELKHALLALGDSWALRWKFRWIRTPVAPLLQLPSTLFRHIKGLGKQMLFGKSS